VLGVVGKGSPSSPGKKTKTWEPESDSATSEDDDEVDTTLTRADIPKIVEAVINNIPKEGDGHPDDEDPHLSV